MGKENIKFSRKNIAIQDGYYYYFDERNDTLYKKVSNGKTAFTYPLEPPLGTKQVESLNYDGYYFWTLQEGTTSEDVVVKKWKIENFICILADTFDFIHDSSNKYDCPSFSLEYYNTTLSYELPSHSTELTVSTFGDKIESGTVLTLGPNAANQYEDVTVTGTLGVNGRFGLDFYTSHSYNSGTPIYFSKNLWLVNHFIYTSTGGALYKINLPNKHQEYVLEDSDLELAEASCFYNTVDNQYILFPVGNVLRFFNINTLVVEKSMLMDNIRTNQSTIIPIYALKVVDGSLYRLQEEATYFSQNNSFSSYNYQLSPLRPFVDSVTIDVAPKILPSNGMNIADVVAVARDQFDDPIQIKPMLFWDTDSTGFMTIINTYTNLYGVARSYYNAGVIPSTVTIAAKVTQYD